MYLCCLPCKFPHIEQAKKGHLCGVHGPRVSRGNYRERNLPETDSQIWHRGTLPEINQTCVYMVALLFSSLEFFFCMGLDFHCFIILSAISAIQKWKMFSSFRTLRLVIWVGWVDLLHITKRAWNRHFDWMAKCLHSYRSCKKKTQVTGGI